MIKIRFNKTQMLLDDIKTDEKFIEKWKNRLTRTKNKEKIEALKYQIQTIKDHLARRVDALREFQ